MDGPRLYSELASWWPVMSAPADYAEEAATFLAALRAAVDGPLETLLELGSGGGNNASHLAAHARLTLVEPAAGMRAVSAALNPGCEHLAGDMRTFRTDRSFDAVLVHDAVTYMLSVEDLAAAAATAHAHCRPGGAALFVPDHTRETWRPETTSGGHEDGDRALRYLAWSFDPDPGDTLVTTAYAFLLREGASPVRCVEDVHTLGLFPRAAWLEALAAAGFEASALPFEHSTFEPGERREMFLGRRAP